MGRGERGCSFGGGRVLSCSVRRGREGAHLGGCSVRRGRESAHLRGGEREHLSKLGHLVRGVKYTHFQLKLNPLTPYQHNIKWTGHENKEND